MPITSDAECCGVIPGHYASLLYPTRPTTEGAQGCDVRTPQRSRLHPSVLPFCFRDWIAADFDPGMDACRLESDPLKDKGYNFTLTITLTHICKGSSALLKSTRQIHQSLALKSVRLKQGAVEAVSRECRGRDIPACCSCPLPGHGKSLADDPCDALPP